MLNFDGIHNRNDFARYARSAKATLDAKRQEEENDHIGNFFKGLAHSFVSAVMDFPKIFTTVISAGAALFSGG